MIINNSKHEKNQYFDLVYTNDYIFFMSTNNRSVFVIGDSLVQNK